MARQLRIEYPDAFYHVTSRGNNRQDIYRDEEDYKLFLERLIESLLDVYNTSLLFYVCMTNHFHFLLTTPDGNLSNNMRHFNIGYTAAFNRRHKRQKLEKNSDLKKRFDMVDIELSRLKI
jgi:REP element-mobilizing transposase RayT